MGEDEPGHGDVLLAEDVLAAAVALPEAAGVGDGVALGADVGVAPDLKIIIANQKRREEKGVPFGAHANNKRKTAQKNKKEKKEKKSTSGIN